MLRALKQLGKGLAGAFGLEIRKKRPETERASMRGALRQLKSLGFAPGTVIDVGVAYETGDLYPEFPNARILLIEPQAEFEPCLQEICRKYKEEGARVGDAVRLLHVVGDDDDRDQPAQLVDRLLDATRGGRVERGRRPCRSRSSTTRATPPTIRSSRDIPRGAISSSSWGG